jgi:hypothetical protein
MSHEVDQEIEDDHVDGLVGEIDDVAGDGLGGLMIEGIAVVLFDHRAFSVDSEYLNASVLEKHAKHRTYYLELTCKGVKKQSKEDQSTAVIETRRVILQIEEHTPQHQRHNQVKNERRNSESRIRE